MPELTELQRKAVRLNHLAGELRSLSREMDKLAERRAKFPPTNKNYHHLNDQLEALHQRWARLRRQITALKENA